MGPIYLRIFFPFVIHSIIWEVTISLNNLPTILDSFTTRLPMLLPDSGIIYLTMLDFVNHWMNLKNAYQTLITKQTFAQETATYVVAISQ